MNKRRSNEICSFPIETLRPEGLYYNNKKIADYKCVVFFCCDYIYTYIVKSEQFGTFKDHNLIIQIVRMKKRRYIMLQYYH